MDEAGAAAAVAQIAPAVVKTTTGQSMATGIWSLVSLVGAAIVALLAFLPKWRTLGIGARKDAIERLDERVNQLENNLRTETAARVSAQMQVSYLVAAFGMVSAELERRDPDSIVIRQARDMVAKATKRDGLAGDLMEALDMVPDSGGFA